MIKILGIDVGLNCTGWGVINLPYNKTNTIVYCASGVIRHKQSQKLPLEDKLNNINHNISHIIQQYSQDAILQVAIEEVFSNKNTLSSQRLSMAKAAIMIALSNNHLPYQKYTTTQIKKAITGSGRADKQQIRYMIENVLLHVKCDYTDEYDAIGTAICHAFHIST